MAFPRVSLLPHRNDWSEIRNQGGHSAGQPLQSRYDRASVTVTFASGPLAARLERVSVTTEAGCPWVELKASWRSTRSSASAPCVSRRLT